MHALARHAPSQPHGEYAVAVDVHRRPTSLELRYVLIGDLRRLSLPAAAASPRRADDLWQDTCFEAFLASPGDAAYREVNLSPGGDWNVYRFGGYRADGRPDDAVSELPFSVATTAERLTLEVRLAIPAGPLDLALTAVLRDLAGGTSHWALRHDGPRPDFHLRSSFVLRI